MGDDEDGFDAFTTATDDPYLGLLVGSIDEPDGLPRAVRAGQLTVAWWDTHGTGPTCAQLINLVFETSDWEDVLDDPGRTLLERREQLDLLHRWIISYWTRIGTITFIPGHDNVVRPGTRRSLEQQDPPVHESGAGPHS